MSMVIFCDLTRLLASQTTGWPSSSRVWVWSSQSAPRRRSPGGRHRGTGNCRFAELRAESGCRGRRPRPDGRPGLCWVALPGERSQADGRAPGWEPSPRSDSIRLLVSKAIRNCPAVITLSPLLGSAGLMMSVPGPGRFRALQAMGVRPEDKAHLRRAQGLLLRPVAPRAGFVRQVQHRLRLHVDVDIPRATPRSGCGCFPPRSMSKRSAVRRLMLPLPLDSPATWFSAVR